MKYTIVILLTLLIVHSYGMNDSTAIINTAALQGYVGAWFKVDTSNLRKSLHPQLSKCKVLTQTSVKFSSTEGLVNALKKKEMKEADIEYQILDISKRFAAIKVTNQYFWDLIFLTKFDSVWLITNVVWDNYKIDDVPENDLKSTIKQLIMALNQSDSLVLQKMIHPEVHILNPVDSDHVIDFSYETLMQRIQTNAWNEPTINSDSIQVKILSITKSYASVKVFTDHWGTEYFHLRFLNNQWYLINGLWNRD